MNCDKQKSSVVAYCWANGLIKFSLKGCVPSGAMEIARSGEGVSPRRFRQRIVGCSRLSYKNRPLVPGIPEAMNEAQKLRALEFFRLWTNGKPIPRALLAKLRRDQRDQMDAFVG